MIFLDYILKFHKTGHLNLPVRDSSVTGTVSSNQDNPGESGTGGKPDANPYWSLSRRKFLKRSTKG
jgi:hypothetical protein